MTHTMKEPQARLTQHSPESPARLFRSVALAAGAAMATLLPIVALAQACSSDGRRPPIALVERFISADCGDCWSAADTPQLPRGALALDWIVPGQQGDDAPLSAAISRDALARLATLQRKAPTTSENLTSPAAPAGRLRLRVAHGPAFSGYIGASMELRPAAGIKGPFTAWMALVETIPAGTEGSPVERNLVRNVFNPDWRSADAPQQPDRKRYIDSRPMNIPKGANPDRLRVIGWIEDAKGRIRVISQTHCEPAG